MWELIYIIVSLIVAYIGIYCSSLFWWGICVLVLLALLYLSTQYRGLKEFYEDASDKIAQVVVVTEKGEQTTPSLWTNLLELPKNVLETVKPSLNHVIDSVSGKNTPDQPQPDSDGNVPQEPTPKEQIKTFLGKDASNTTVDDMAYVCFYLHTMKGTDPLAYKRLVKTYLNR